MEFRQTYMNKRESKENKKVDGKLVNNNFGHSILIKNNIERKLDSTFQVQKKVNNIRSECKIEGRKVNK